MPNSTPFFAAFGSLLFGRAPRCRLQELLGQGPQMPSINQYMEAFGEFIPQTLLARSKEKVNSRQRIFRRLTAKFEKIIVDVQAASPSSWKTDCMAVRMVS